MISRVLGRVEGATSAMFARAVAKHNVASCKMISIGNENDVIAGRQRDSICRGVYLAVSRLESASEDRRRSGDSRVTGSARWSPPRVGSHGSRVEVD